MVACVHACMHGPWLSLDLDAPSSLELPRTRKPLHVRHAVNTLAHLRRIRQRVPGYTASFMPSGIGGSCLKPGGGDLSRAGT